MRRSSPRVARRDLLANADLAHTLELLAAGGRLVLGHTKRDTLEVVAPWTEAKMLKHGDTVMRFLELL